MIEKEGDFDWVTALSACSASQIFETLKLQVKSDMETRKALQPSADRHYEFATHERNFSISLDHNESFHVVTFSLEKKGIVVKDENEVMFSATPTLNNAGECRLKIDGQARTLWQVRMMALENLLFGES
jgi:hypothetical protein